MSGEKPSVQESECSGDHHSKTRSHFKKHECGQVWYDSYEESEEQNSVMKMVWICKHVLLLCLYFIRASRSTILQEYKR